MTSPDPREREEPRPMDPLDESLARRALRKAAMTDRPVADQQDTPRRGTALLLSDFERLEEWCRLVKVVFYGECPYLVGSAARTPQYRDVDLRLILRDAVYDRWFSDPVRVRLVNRAVSIWGQKETSLPIDFQVQRMTDANEAFGGEYRNPMGLRDWTVNVPSGHPGGRRHD